MFKVTRGYVLAATLTSADQTAETPYPVFSSQTKDKGLMGYYKDYLYEDAITWTTDGANAGTVNFRAGKFYCTNVCGVLLTDSVKASPAVAEALNNVAKSYVSYVGNPKLMNNVMADIEIYIPFAQTEQEKISQVFTTLDNLITLHQRKQKDLFFLILSKKLSLILANDWEQRKLGDIGRVAMNRRIFKEQTSAEGSVPFYKIGTFGGEPDAFISDELYQEYKERFPYPKVGDILLSASGSIGKMVEYKGEKAYFQDSNIVWLDHDASVSNAFLKCFYSVVKWAGLEGSTIKRLYNKNILETQIALPSYAEQCLIGDFFEHIDNLITLHQCKENLVQSKYEWHSLFQMQYKLADDWEQRKLGDVVSRFATGLNPRDNFTLNSGGKNYYVTIKNFTHGNLVLDDNCDKIDDEALALIQARSDLRIGDILFSSIGRVGDCFLIENRPINWNINESVFVLRPVKDAVDPLYLMHTIHSERVLSVILSCVTGSTFKSIKMAQLKETNIPYPSIAEQKQIGKFITAIDNLITLHQCKRAAFFDWKRWLYSKFEESKITLAWEQRKLGDVFLYERPNKYIVASDKYSDFYSTPVLTANKGFVLGYTNEKRTYNTPCVIFDDFTLDSKYVDFPFMVKSSALKILTTKQGYYLPFAYELLHAANIEVLGHARHYISVVQPTMVLVPSYSEQLRVGKFIEAIDNLITLHQRGEKINNRRQT